MRSSGENEIELDSGFAANTLDLILDLHTTFALCK